MNLFESKEITLLTLAAICFSCCAAAAQDRYAPVARAVAEGDRETASSMLDDIFRDDFIDAEGLYYCSRLEQKGERSIEHLQQALRLCEDRCGAVPAELADAYYASGRYEDVITLYKEYRKRVENSRENMKLFWFAGMSFVELEDYAAAEKAFKEIERDFDDMQLTGWGTLGRASARAAGGKTNNAISTLDPLVRSGGAVSTLAIYNRAYFAAESGDDDDALFGYNVLSQRFGEFLGNAELGELLLSGRSRGGQGAAEKLVDITYTIEMGTFGDKSEADKLVGKLKAANWSASLSDMIQGDRKYWVVRVGIFRTRRSAQETKEKLESLYPGSYRVVIR